MIINIYIFPKTEVPIDYVMPICHALPDLDWSIPEVKKHVG
jgi:hypothetical protein